MEGPIDDAAVAESEAEAPNAGNGVVKGVTFVGVPASCVTSTAENPPD